MVLNPSPSQRELRGHRPIVVCRVAAATFALGLGVAFASGSAVAYADAPSSSETSAADSDSSSGPAKQREASADAKTDSDSSSDSGDAAAPDDAAEPEADATADPESVALVSDSAAPAVAMADQEPNSWAVAVNKVSVRLAGLFGFLPPELTGGNESPPLRTVLEQGFAALRRTFLTGLPNEAPTARPGQVYQFLSGEVIGDLRAFDLNGQRLTYTVIHDGVHGEGAVNPNGTFIYTPTPEMARTGGADSFVVTIDDGTLLPGGGTTTGMTVVPVSVRIAPALGGSWRGYDIVNFDGEDVTITKISGNVDWYRGAGVGHVIKENARFDFHVAEVDTKYNDVYIELTSKSGQVYTVSAKVPHHYTSEKPSTGCATTGQAGHHLQLRGRGVEHPISDGVPRSHLEDGADLHCDRGRSELLLADEARDGLLHVGWMLADGIDTADSAHHADGAEGSDNGRVGRRQH